MKSTVLLIAFCMFSTMLWSQEEFNYDESKVPQYTLPDPLELSGGRKVNTVKEWEKKKRRETLRIFEEQMYGRIPKGIMMTSFRVVEESDQTPYENAIRKQVEMLLKKGDRELRVSLLLYLPKSDKKVPVFLGYNFNGNHSVTEDVEVFISQAWARDNASYGIVNNQLSEKGRGTGAKSWAIGEILKGGYGLATMFYCEVDPDRDDFSDGVHPFVYKKGQTRPQPDEWGAISAWAWGLSRAMDYLQTDPHVDASKVAVMGHSRLGKASLWAGATDPRFAIVISNNSGCGGAALSRRKYGETVKRINTNFPHWFCDNFLVYNDNENSLPIDQHQLIALIAPRPVYIASAEEDRWADPRGEYLSGHYATPVYTLYGLEGLPSGDMPGVHNPVMNHVGYHIREGVHAVTLYDWQQYIRFADKHFFSRQP